MVAQNANPPAGRLYVLILGPGLTANGLKERFVQRGASTVTIETGVGNGAPVLRPFEQGSVESLKSKVREWLASLPPEEGRSAVNVTSGVFTTKFESAEFWVHPGVSGWADRPDFPGICQELGAIGISIGARSLARISDRLHLLLHAESLGLQTLLLHREPFLSSREVERWVTKNKVSFPFVLKTVHGSGPFSMIDIRDAEDLVRRLPLWTEQLRRQTGEVMLFVEKVLEGARIVSLPFARNNAGRLRCFSTIDSSIRSRHRRIIEFSPAQTTGVLTAIEANSKLLLDSLHLVGLGLIEFLIDGDRVFLVNFLPRVNSSFPIWEECKAIEKGTTALDWQLGALGLRAWPESDEIKSRDGGQPALKEMSTVTESGGKESDVGPDFPFALCARIIAEDSLLQLPQPGWIRERDPDRFGPIEDAEVTIQWAVTRQQDLSSERSGLLGTLLVRATSRARLLEVARWALKQVWIAGGIQTNERLIYEILDHPWVREGAFHASFLDEEFIPQLRPSNDLAGLMAGLCEFFHLALEKGLDESSTKKQSLRWIAQDQWVVPRRDWEFCAADGGPCDGPGGVAKNDSEASYLGQSGWIRVDGESEVQRFCISPVREHKWLVRMGAWFVSVRVVAQKGTQAKKAPRLLALVSGRVHSILYPKNIEIPAHEPVVILESLGQLIPHALPRTCSVIEWKVQPQSFVKAGEVLADIDIYPSASRH